jgi:hypothetical protein
MSKMLIFVLVSEMMVHNHLGFINKLSGRCNDTWKP